MRTDGAPAGPAELNRVRVEVSDRFAHIDQHFEAQVVGVARTVRDIYANSLGDLVPRSDAPLEDLRLLAARIRAGEEPAPNLADALDELSSVSFSYRTHLYPEVRRVIREFLSWTRRDPETGQLVPLVTVEPTDEGARQLMQVIRQQAQQVALHSRSELIRRAQTPALLTHAVTEHFADRVMRKGDQSRAEFQKVCRSYRDTIWPGEFEGFISVRKSSAAIRQTHRRLVDELDMLNQETQ